MESSVFSTQLTALAEENRAAEKAYSQVVPHIENKQFGKLLDDSIEDRIRFRKEIEAAIPGSDNTKNEENVHPSWLHLYEMFSTSNDEAMLGEAIRGEGRSLDLYQKVLNNAELSPEQSAVLRNHIESLQKSKKTFEGLRNTAG